MVETYGVVAGKRARFFIRARATGLRLARGIALVVCTDCSASLTPGVDAGSGGSGEPGADDAQSLGTPESSMGTTEAGLGPGSGHGMDSGSRDATSPLDTGHPCVSNGSTINRHSDGTCDQASQFGVCNGDILEVDCLCPSGHALCICLRDGRSVQMVGYDCSTCPAVGASWTACGFPAL
jgi:hypothetical protein